MTDRPKSRPPLDGLVAAAVDRHRAGDAAGAAAGYRLALARQPADANLWRLLGLALRQTGAVDRALAALEKAHGLAPVDDTIAADYGCALVAAGQTATALRVLAPASERLAEAPALAALGDALLAAGRAREAVSAYRRSLAIDPGNAAAHANLGAAWHRVGEFGAAVVSCEAALARDPTSLDAMTNLGLSLLELDRPDEALPSLVTVAVRAPGDARAHCNLGAAYQRQGRGADARACFEAAAAADPSDAAAWSNLANALQDDLAIDAALVAHDRAVTLMPEDADVRWNRANTLLLAGQWTLGFAEYEWRARTLRHAPRRRAVARWEGDAPAGRRILLQAEQGFGDAIQFARYAPLLAARGADVTLACRARLVPLLATLPAVRVVDEDGPMPPADAFEWLMSLPRLFGTTPATAPADVPYLRVPEGARPPPPHGGRPRIGIAWAGNPAHPDNRARSCPPSALGPLFALEGVEWVSLQFGADPAAVSPALWDWSHRLDGFADSAAAVAALDLVLTVDTMTAHLAGALGRPVWLMLKSAPDWRWLLGRDDTPWYPNMRLFRQPWPGAWDRVVADVADALAAEFLPRYLPYGKNNRC